MEKAKLFETDGVRGEAYKYPFEEKPLKFLALAIAKTFKEDLNKDQLNICIGKDTRESGDMIEKSLIEGISTENSKIKQCGVIPTSAVSYLTRTLNLDLGIMITASHNPYQDNGIKIISNDGYKISEELERKIEDKFYEIYEKDIQFNSNPNLITEEKSAIEKYTNHLQSIINSEKSNLKIAIDFSNGSACSINNSFFENLASEIHIFNKDPNGKNINEDCGATHPEFISNKVKELNYDLGVCFDGDADRFICCDENGEVISGDIILSLFAKYLLEKNKLSKNTVILTKYSNMALYKYLDELNIETLKVLNGDKYIGWLMKKNRFNFGGESSGHIIFNDHSRTGDGLISLIKLIEIMKEENKPLSELKQIFDLFPQVMLNLRVNSKPDIDTLKKSSETIQKYKDHFNLNGEILVRYSGTENLCRIMIQGKNKEEIQKAAEDIKNTLDIEINRNN